MLILYPYYYLQFTLLYCYFIYYALICLEYSVAILPVRDNIAKAVHIFLYELHNHISRQISLYHFQMLLIAVKFLLSSGVAASFVSIMIIA
jgi:hypothetical protein